MTDPLDALWVLSGGTGLGYHAFDCIHDGQRVTLWTRADNRERYMRLVSPVDERRDLAVTACPYLELGSRRLHADSSVVWARTDSRGQVKRLTTFKPRPTIVLQEGNTVRRVALWALTKPITPEDCKRVNQHLAHKLGTKKMHASPGFTFNPPGAVLTEGRKKPIYVSVAGMTGEVYPVGVVCRRLPREIPDPDAWRLRAAA